MSSNPTTYNTKTCTKVFYLKCNEKCNTFYSNRNSWKWTKIWLFENRSQKRRKLSDRHNTRNRSTQHTTQFIQFWLFENETSTEERTLKQGEFQVRRRTTPSRRPTWVMADGGHSSRCMRNCFRLRTGSRRGTRGVKAAAGFFGSFPRDAPYWSPFDSWFMSPSNLTDPLSLLLIAATASASPHKNTMPFQLRDWTTPLLRNRKKRGETHFAQDEFTLGFCVVVTGTTLPFTREISELGRKILTRPTYIVL